MNSNNVGSYKKNILLAVYQKLINIMGEKRFYPEVQWIDKSISNDIDKNSVLSNKKILIALMNLLVVIIRRIINKLFWVEQWYLLFSMGNAIPVFNGKYVQMIPPRDRFWADPHIIHKDHRYYVFVEEYFFHSRKGCISVIEIDETGKYNPPKSVLERPYHLSYPFTFSYGNKYYMVPETSENKTIDLYECVKFPTEWRFLMHLMENVSAVDTTIFYYNDLWWLFTAMPDKFEALPKIKLFLFYSERLFTNEWKAHSKNPIIPDMGNARPAGKIYTNNYKIYRPSQDCTTSYGHSIDINEITLLSKNDYEEKKVMSIQPNWEKSIKGTHTFSHENMLTVLDVYRKFPRMLIKTKI